MKHCSEIGWDELESRAPARAREILVAIRGARPKRPQAVSVARYRYGADILQTGQFQVPCVAEHRDNECHECRSLSGRFPAGQLPLGLVLENPVEVYLQESTHLTPLRVLGPGEWFGVFEALDAGIIAGREEFQPVTASGSYNVSSGAKSARLIAPCSTEWANRLCRSDRKHRAMRALNSERPEDRSSELIRIFNEQQDSPWSVEVALLRPDLAARLETPARARLLEVGWTQGRHLLSRSLEDSAWLERYHEYAASSSTAGMLTLRTARHLLYVARGEQPAFKPVGSAGPETGPLRGFQRWLMDEQRFEFLPGLVQPHHVVSSGDHAYYSLSEPTILGPLPRKGGTVVKKEGRSYDDFADSIIGVLNACVENLGGEFVRGGFVYYPRDKKAWRTSDLLQCEVYDELRGRFVEDERVKNALIGAPQRAGFVNCYIRVTRK